MKLLLVPFLLIGALLHPIAQEPVVQGFPSCKLDFKKAIEIVAEYNVIHQDTISGGQYWGLTLPGEHKMYLSDAPDLAIRRLTVIHEMLHVCYNRKGIDTHDGIGEETVAKSAEVLYRELYGSDE